MGGAGAFIAAVRVYVEMLAAAQGGGSEKAAVVGRGEREGRYGAMVVLRVAVRVWVGESVGRGLLLWRVVQLEGGLVVVVVG